jgi:hypothetical protein
VEAHYYSPKELNKDTPSLAQLMGVSQESFQALLVASQSILMKDLSPGNEHVKREQRLHMNE